MHRAAQAAWRYRDIAFAHVDRPNPQAVAAARAQLLRALAATAASPYCADCQFWEPTAVEDGHALGLCRRNPPAYEGWPMTGENDWCAEFCLQP